MASVIASAPVLGRARIFRLTIALVSGWAILASRASVAQEPDGKLTVGERVVLRNVPGEILIYRVAAVDGAKVKLKAEGNTETSVWPESEVVPVLHAIDIFTAEIEQNSCNASAYLPRFALA